MPNSVLDRRPGESDFEYHRRLVVGKLGDKTLSDYDYDQLSKYVYGKEYSRDVARRMIYGSKRTIDYLTNSQIESTVDSDMLSELDEKMIELRKERQKFFDQRTAFNKVVRERARQEELNEIITGAINKGDLPRLDYKRASARYCANDLLVSLNDIHYGATHSNYWGEYNSDICRERFNKYLNRITDIAERHCSENCIIWENGDAISGSIHKTIQISNKENVIEQITGVSELIAEFIAELSTYFASVKFVSVAGNHSRLDPNKDASLSNERLDDLIEWYLKARLQNFENVDVEFGERIDPTMYLINIRGKNYVGVHGDFDPNSSKIQSLQTMAGKPIYAVLMGHLHHNETNMIQGIHTIMAGSFMGMDDYCVQKRIYGHPEQMVCVCDDGGVVCHYDILLDDK